MVKEGAHQTLYWAGTTIEAVRSVFSQAKEGKAPEGVAGPVGIFQIIQAVRREGFLPLATLVGILSVNLAILNIMQLPALDGGRLLFILIEGVMGKKVVPKFEALVHTVGMLLLLLLLFAITAYDIRRLIEAVGISNFLDFVAR